MAREGVYMLCCYEAVPPNTVADCIRDVRITQEEKVDTPIEPYTRVNNSSLMAILQNTGSDQRAFQGNIAHHAKSMREYTAANSSTQRTLGRAAAEALGLKLHKPVREVWDAHSFPHHVKYLLTCKCSLCAGEKV